MSDTSSIDSIFTKIIKREIPGKIQYEDDQFIVFNDIHPQAPVHVLIVSKEPHESLEKISTEDIHFHAELLLVARKVAKLLGIQKSYKLMMNVGAPAQEVMHLHLHLMGGWK